MKKNFLTALGLCALVCGSASAAPFPPALGTPRAPVQLGALKPVKDYVLFDRIMVDRNGHYLGWVENVEYVGGIPTQIKLSYDNYTRAAWIFVEHVQFDPQNKVVVTDMTPERIQRISFLD